MSDVIIYSYTVDWDGFRGEDGGKVFNDYAGAKAYYDKLVVAYKCFQKIIENRTRNTIDYEVLESEG